MSRRERLTAAEQEKRQDRALELHLAGASYSAICEAVGFSSKATAHKAVQDALIKRAADPSHRAAVQLELARLDAMLTGLWAKARRGDVAAVDRVMRISERRTQLLAVAGQPSTPTTTTTEGGAGVASIADRRARRLAATQGQ